ncbi:MAG: HEPN domain-containing protein [Nitrospirae bacterium]|nr:HEPN domain-containing protein [Nitrospirota bacterium]
MTEENKRENIKVEMERSVRALREADVLFENELVSGAVSRLYYSLLYGMRALLLARGFEPKSHEGALRLFGLHFVKEGIFGISDSHVFSRLMKYREEADYNAAYSFSNDDFVGFRKEALALTGKIEVYLKEKGYL